MQTEPELRAGPLIRSAFRDLFRRPFSTILMIQLLINVTGGRLPTEGDDFVLIAGLVLGVCDIYLDITTLLVAAQTDPDPRADPWIRAALARRCFWRYCAAMFLWVLLVTLGALALVVGAFIAGAIVGLAPSAALLERRSPVDAIKRSAELSRPARKTVGVVCGALQIIPFALTLSLYNLVLDDLSRVWQLAALPLVPVAMAGTIAMARAFVALGGEVRSGTVALPPV